MSIQHTTTLALTLLATVLSLSACHKIPSAAPAPAKSGPGVNSEEAAVAVGAPDKRLWFAKGVAGIDWLETEFPKPVSATEVRVVVTYRVKTLAQLELQDTTGAQHTVYSGVSDEPNTP